MMEVCIGDAPSSDLAWEKMSIDEILSLATTPSLLGDAYTYKISGALSSERADEFLAITKELLTSTHEFLFFEEKLLKKTIDKLQKVGAQVVTKAAAKKSDSLEAFNIFSLTFAFASRDRKKLWLLLLEAGRREVVPEAILGILHWKVRDMLASKAEMRAYSRQELQHSSRELVSLYHESHRGAGDLSLLLERFVLRI